MSQKPVSVLHLISSLGIGGAERLLIDTLHAAKDDPAIAYVAAIMNEAVNPGFFAELEASGAPVYRLNRREGHLSPKYLRDLLAIIDRHKVEVIHTHNEGSRSWGMLAKLLRPRLKLVYTIHSHDNADSITGLKRKAYRLVDASVAISEFVASTAHVLKPKSLTLVPNGIGLDRFRAIAPRAAVTGAFRIVNVARFIPFKGQDVLIEALALARARGTAIHATFVGTIAEQPFFDRLQALVAEHQLGASVSFAVGRTDIETFFTQSDAFVLSSRDEGFGIAIVEAMAAGMPVIAPKVGGAAEIVVDGINGLHFTASNATDLADRLVTLAADPALRARLSAAGRVRASDYDIRTMAGSLRDLYCRLTGRAT